MMALSTRTCFLIHLLFSPKPFVSERARERFISLQKISRPCNYEPRWEVLMLQFSAAGVINNPGNMTSCFIIALNWSWVTSYLSLKLLATLTKT